MKKILSLFFVLMMVLTVNAQNKVYKFKVKNADNKNVSLKQYKGKVLLIVNSATHCGFTKQYTELQNLYEKYGKDGFVILDFPCNQFNGQAPGSYEEIHKFCTGKYNITFPQFAKIDVNGPNADPLYVFLKKTKGFEGFGISPVAARMDGMLRKRDPNYDKKPDIKWNFTKFLIDRKGNVVERFEPTEDLKKVDEAIAQILK